MNTSVTSMADGLPGRANTIAAPPTAIREETLHSSYTSVTTKIPLFLHSKVPWVLCTRGWDVLEDRNFLLIPFIFFLMITCSLHQGVHPNAREAENRGSDTSTRTFTAALCTTAKRGDHPECPSVVNEWTKCGTYTYVHTHWNIIQPQKERKFWHVLQHEWALRTLRKVK